MDGRHGFAEGLSHLGDRFALEESEFDHAALIIRQSSETRHKRRYLETDHLTKTGDVARTGEGPTRLTSHTTERGSAIYTRAARRESSAG